jgi:acyl-CoA thioester hydrolase
MRGKEVLAEATVVAALLSPQGRPIRQPAEWVETFKALEQNEE